MTIGDVVSRLAKAKKTGNGFVALCPAHDDRLPSLSISEGSGGKVILNCFTGCSPYAIVDAIGLKIEDLFPDKNGRSLARSPTNFAPAMRTNGNGSNGTAKNAYKANTIAEIYEYTDAKGDVLYENVRYEPKDFRQRRPDGSGGYIYNLDGIDRVPYRLPELINAINNGIDEIWLAEGEKDVDNLRLLGFTATSFKNWTQCLNPYIKRVHAVLFRDHDASGVRQADDAARIIAAAAESVKVINLFFGEPVPNKHGKDITDWIEARRSEGLDNEAIAERLAVVTEGTEFWQDTPDAADSSNVSGLDIEFLSTVTAQEVIWLARPLIPYGFFTLLDGIEGIGKTYAMLDIAKRLTRGEAMPFMGEKHAPASALFLSVEDSPEYVLKPRFEKMQGDCSRLAILRGNFQFSDAGFADLEQTILIHNIKFVLIDPLFSFTGPADINNTSAVRPITDRLNGLAAKYEIAIVGIRHINKSKGYGDPRNAGAHSVAWLQGSRSGLIVGHDAEDKTKRGIAQTKLNIAAESRTVHGFVIDAEGVFSWTGESDLTVADMLAHKSNESNEDRSAIADAMSFLKKQLADGSKFKNDLDSEARGEGISMATLNRAKMRLKIKPQKTGHCWSWALPQDDQDTQVAH